VNPDSRAWVLAALDRYEKPLLRYAAWLLDDRDRARDVVQEAFLRLCGQSPDRVGDHLAEWLFTVCRNLALDLREKESRRNRLDQTRAIPVGHILAAGFADAAEKMQLLRQILEIIDTLPDRQREVAYLKFHQGFSYKEISALTGDSVSNVGFLIHQALNTIRQRVHAGHSNPVFTRRVQ